MKEFDSSQEKQKTRIPQSLLIAGILTILGTGTTIVSSLISLLLGKPSEEEIMNSKLKLARPLEDAQKNNIQFLEEMIKNMQIMLDAMYENFFLYTLIASAIALVGLAGVILMFLRREIGFHLYIIYSFLYVVQNYIFVSPQTVPLVLIISYIFVSGIFIYIYSRSLNWFRYLNS